MSSHLRQMNCVWMAGRLISTAATPLIYSRISHWFPSDTGYLIHPRRWGMRNFGGEKRRMEYALRHLDCTVALFFRLAFLPFFFFSSDAAVPQSCGCNSVTVLPPPQSPCSTTTITTTFFPFLSLHLYLSPPSVRRAPAPSPRVCRGVSEWWSFSGPCERSCGFSVPHIRGRALALCMLQEFGLAEHQALTTSSPALAAARRGPDKLPEPRSQMYMKLCRCPTVYIYIH